MAILTRETDGDGVTNNDAPLTNSQLDNNFIELAARLAADSTDTLTNKTIDSITNKVGADHIHYKVKATEALANGDLVQVTGYNSGEDAYEVAKISADDQVAVGIVADGAIANGDFGSVTNTGLVEGIDTDGFSVGDILFGDGAGGFTSTQPTTGIFQACAFVLRAHASNGAVLVEFTNPEDANSAAFIEAVTLPTSFTAATDQGKTLVADNAGGLSWGYPSMGIADLSDVDDSISPTDNQLLGYDSATSKWVAQSETQEVATQTNNSGKYLTTDGSTTSWAAISGDLSADQVDFTSDLSADPAYQEGRVFYDSTHKCLTYYNDDSGTMIHAGQQVVVRVYNGTGSTISVGSPTYISGVNSGTPSVSLGNATDMAKYNIDGLAAADIANGEYGYITVQGLVRDMDTSAYTVGNRVFLGLTDGSLTETSPTYPNFPMCIGVVVTSSATDGIIAVMLQNHSVKSFRVVGDAHVGGDMIVSGDLTVQGTQTIADSTNIETGAPFLYLNAGDTIGEANTTFTGSGLDDAYFTGHFKGTSSTTYYVQIDGVGTGTGGVDTFKWSKDNFTTTEASGVDITGSDQALDNGIKILFATTTDHTSGDQWSGTAAPVNVDTGIWSNRNDGVTYTHSGIFLDVSDSNTFKFVKSYDPEPTGTIDTSDSSFTLGNVDAYTVHADGSLVSKYGTIYLRAGGSTNTFSIQSSATSSTVNQFYSAAGRSVTFVQAANSTSIPAMQLSNSALSDNYLYLHENYGIHFGLSIGQTFFTIEHLGSTGLLFRNKSTSTALMLLDPNGNLKVAGDITAYADLSAYDDSASRDL